VVEHPEPGVAREAQQAADDAGVVAVIDMQ
jgi:hypothetical protein